MYIQCSCWNKDILTWVWTGFNLP